MTFSDPVLLAVGLVVVAGLAWWAAAAARRRARVLRNAGVTLPQKRRSLGPLWLTIAGLAVLAFAAAGPAVTVPESHASGTVILAVDASGSMSATDVAPSRLGAAKAAATAFINAQPGTVDIGVIAFEEGGLDVALPSADHSRALAAVSRLAPRGGTSLGAAILAAMSAITHKNVTVSAGGAGGAEPAIGFWPSATIVLFSDGQDGAGPGTAGSGTGSAATVAQRAGVHVDTVGVGTAAGTTVVADGYHLFTALDADPLRAIAQTTGGSYHPASDASELNGIASSINLRLTVSHQPLPLAGAIIVLALLLLAAGGALAIIRTGRVI
jgi:Ca-activated chloride channel family protein